MPIVFEQPQPLDPLTSINAGRAGVIEKSLGPAASLYEAAIRARNSGGGGGGGGGGNGGIQVLPSSDYGSLAQVEGNANREQQSVNIGNEETAALDLQNNRFNQQNNQLDRERRAQIEQDRAAIAEGTPDQRQFQKQPAPIFSPGDMKSLADAQQDLTTLDEKEQSGEISGQEAWPARQAVNGRIAELQEKQNVAREFQKQQLLKQRDEGEAHQHGSWIRESDVMSKAAPGQKLTSGEVVVTTFPDGTPSLIKHWDLQHHAWKYEHMKPPANTRTPADILQEKKFAHEAEMAKDKRESLALEKADARMMRFREQASKELKGDIGMPPPTPDQIEERAERIKKHFDSLHGIKATPPEKADPTANVINRAVRPVPQAQAKFQEAIKDIPRNGKALDLPKATNKQLDVLSVELNDPDKLGITKEAADAIKLKIQAVKATQPPPPPGAGRSALAPTPDRQELPQEPYKPGVEVPVVPSMNIWDALKLFRLPRS